MFIYDIRIRKHYIIIRTLLLISFFSLVAFPDFTQEWAPLGATWYYTEKFLTWNQYDEDSTIGLYETGLADSCNYRHQVMQEIMTIRETFDFEVGDVFQIRGMADGQPPNADRITITGKYFSSQKDTLYYIRYHNSYYFDIDSLKNHFWQKTDTVFYTDLDSSLLYYNHFEFFDFSAYISTQYCDSLVNAFSSVAMDTTTPSDHLTKNYARGLGTIKSFLYDVSGGNVDYNDVLFYYKQYRLVTIPAPGV